MVKEAFYARPLGRFTTNPRSGRSERYFGPTSQASLILDIKDIIAERFEAEPHRLSEYAQEAQNKINLLTVQGERALLTDGPPPTPPPFAILDAMIEPYFAMNNQHFPIWRKEKFIEIANDLRHSASPEREHASSVCCNNLILITLTANSLRSCRGRSTQSTYTSKRSSIDSDIIAGFLANAKRAIEHIELLLSPCLLNLQALLSLVCSSLSITHEMSKTWRNSLTRAKHPVRSSTRVPFLRHFSVTLCSCFPMREVHWGLSVAVLSASAERRRCERKERPFLLFVHSR